MDEYVIWSNEHRRFWGPDETGYVAGISQAGRYSHHRALQICAEAIPGAEIIGGVLPELPIRLADLEAMVAAYREVYPEQSERWA